MTHPYMIPGKSGLQVPLPVYAPFYLICKEERILRKVASKSLSFLYGVETPLPRSFLGGPSPLYASKICMT